MSTSLSSGGQAWSDAMTAQNDVNDFPTSVELHVVPTDLAASGSARQRNHLATAAGRAYRVVGKRLIDILGSLLLLLLLLPVLCFLACWIRFDSPGSPIFLQRRVGERQGMFTIWKFRTMVRNGAALIDADPAVWAQYAANWKLPNDPRVTRSGTVLRKWSLDELPQLWNVLKGDMSLVGPRPYLPHELADEFGIHAGRITSVKPGMTGLWQVSGRSNLTPHDRIQLDEVYVRNCSLRYDLLIIFRTVKVVLLRDGAH